MALLDSMVQQIRLKPVLAFMDEKAREGGGRPLNVVDVGCGDGSLKRELVSRGHNVMTCDLHHGDVSADFNNPLPFEDDQFEVAVSMAVAEHLREPHLFLKELRRIAKAVILTTPSVYAPPVLDALAGLRLVNREHILDHRVYLTKEFIEECGYDHAFFCFGMNQIGISSER